MDREAGDWARQYEARLLHRWLEALRMGGEPFFSADPQRLHRALKTIFNEIVHYISDNRFDQPLEIIEALRVQPFPVRYREFAGLLLTGRRIAFDEAADRPGSEKAETLRVLRAVDDAFVQLNLYCLDLWPGPATAVQASTDGAVMRTHAIDAILAGKLSRTNLLYNAFQYSTDGIVITDLHGNMIEANRALIELFGYSYNEIIGQNTRIFQSPQTTQGFYRHMWDAINRTGRWSGEIANCRKDGTEIPIFLSITPIYESGRKVGYMGVEIDLRKQKKMEERLLQSERLAVIGRMAAKVAHEIRNPLSSISLNAELLLDELRGRTDAGGLESKSLLDAIISEVDRVAKLTEEYLQFSRLPESRFHKDDLVDLLHEVAGFIDPELAAKEIYLRCKPDPGLPKLVFDRQQMRRALLNLLRNSKEAMPRGGTIHLGAALQNGSVMVSIEDSGGGIAPEDLPYIFDPFFTTKDFGTGLGLALTQQIISEHGGNISCESRLGRGTTFTIALPVGEQHELEESFE